MVNSAAFGRSGTLGEQCRMFLGTLLCVVCCVRPASAQTLRNVQVVSASRPYLIQMHNIALLPIFGVFPQYWRFAPSLAFLLHHWRFYSMNGVFPITVRGDMVIHCHCQSQ
jgi:hypothetical protein